MIFLRNVFLQIKKEPFFWDEMCSIDIFGRFTLVK